MLLLERDGSHVRAHAVGSAVDIAADARVVPLPGRPVCGLLARGRVTVNGLPALPFQVLRDRDEITVDGRTLFFSADALPELSLMETGKRMRCARCLTWLDDGAKVIRCPACRAHHHPECWSEGDGCQKCRRCASGLAWIPEPV